MIVAFCGRIGSGKNSAAEYLESHYGYYYDSFANPLKDSIAAVFGWDRNLLEGVTDRSRKWRDTVDPWWAERLNMPHLTPRWVLQHWGTDLIRDKFASDMWIASFENRARDKEKIVLSDCRFKNEAHVLRKLGGIVVNITRGPTPEWWTVAQSAAAGDTAAQSEMEALGIHSSEYSLADFTFDYEFSNDGTIDELYTQINSIV